MSVFTLYRFYNAEDVLLYVGLTIDPSRRLREHRAGKSWWLDIARIDLEHLDSIEQLRDAERQAIQTEKPLYNIALTDITPGVGNAEKRRTLEWMGYRCISNAGAGTYVRDERPGVTYTRAAAWTQVQR